MMPLLRRLQFRFLDREKTGDYVVLLLVCGFPIVFAWLLGVDKSYTAPEGLYLGYFDKNNFWPLAFIVPAALWLIRREMTRVANISSPDIPSQPPALIQLIETQESRSRVYQLMRDWMASSAVMSGTLIIAVTITVLDMRELITGYVMEGTLRIDELDWSVMYRIGVVSKSTNLLFVASAYLVQFIITTMGVFCVLFLLRHNLFFIDRIYQRHRVPVGEEADYIRINLNDVNKCFGFRVANDAFNTQVTALIVGGVVVLFSRFASVRSSDLNFTVENVVLKAIPIIEGAAFPDIGQLLLGVFWVLALGIVSIPGIVKLLPRLSGDESLKDLAIADYLKEFIDDANWKYGDQPTSREIDFIAAQFAENSFWPTGDNRASQLFFFSGWILLIILYPIKSDDPVVLAISLTIFGIIAYAMRVVVFLILNRSLAYVDERLATRRPDLINELQNKQIRVRSRIFVSYRREDSMAYTRLLRQSLSAYMDAAEIFMDVETINDGADFIDTIERAVSECDAVLVIIGKDWASAKNEQGEKRLWRDDDFVRLEIRVALATERLIIPVLVGDAQMPGLDELPEELAPLWRRNARRLSDAHWEQDVEALARSLVDAK